MTASALVVACAGRDGAGGAVGVSDKVSGGYSARDAGDDAPLDGAVALPPGYRESFIKVNKARFVSQGHAAGRWEVDVWANELAAKALAARAREVPPGAIVVEEHFERGAAVDASAEGERPSGPIMVMEKKPAGFAKEHGDWRWAVVGSQGQLVRDGVIETCAGCHDDAPMDGLFPIVE
ncbi:MAG: cytochrome P460 family protein [Labilithrix sp.]|nr:cytochrome P460 family protein [Labilithrix sp.]MBX3219889.1 cytochrome P460 family protein [Labilithrix sp.]